MGAGIAAGPHSPDLRFRRSEERCPRPSGVRLNVCPKAFLQPVPSFAILFRRAGSRPDGGTPIKLPSNPKIDAAASSADRFVFLSLQCLAAASASGPWPLDDLKLPPIRFARKKIVLTCPQMANAAVDKIGISNFRQVRHYRAWRHGQFSIGKNKKRPLGKKPGDRFRITPTEAGRGGGGKPPVEGWPVCDRR